MKTLKDVKVGETVTVSPAFAIVSGIISSPPPGHG